MVAAVSVFSFRFRPSGAPNSSAVPRRLTLLCAFVTAMALVTACADTEVEPGQVRFAIAAETCEAYCLTAVRVTLYEDSASQEFGPGLPIGPPLQADCDDEDGLVYATLPAGLVVLAEVDGFDLSGDVVLSGRSEPVTIAAERQTDLVVALTARTAPTIVDAYPDPLLSSATLTVEGDHLDPAGDHGLFIDDTPVVATFAPATDNGPDTISATVTGTGSSLTARRCGIESDPHPIRVIADTPGSAPVTGLPLCNGTAVAAAVNDRVLIAWRCQDEAASQLVVMDDGEVCPLDPALAWPLSGNPTGPLVASAEAAWVGRTTDTARVDLATGALISYPVVGPLARTDRTWALTPSGLIALHDDGTTTTRTDVFPELVHLDMAGKDHLWIAAATPGANTQGRLIAVPTTGSPSSWPLPCVPSRVTVSASHVALLCEDATVLWDIARSTPTEVPLSSPTSLVFAGDDVVFAGGGELHLIDLDPLPGLGPSLIATFPRSTSALWSLSGDRLLIREGQGNTLSVLTPFSPAGPCP